MEGVRGYAVILVFFVHFMLPVVRDVLHHPNITLANADTLLLKLLYLIGKSHYGVDIFFILSGFLIVRLIKKETKFKYTSFILSRFFRIYPAFIVALIVATYFFSFHFKWFDFDLKTFFMNTLLIHGVKEFGVKSYHVVTWSLFYEFIFYFTVPVLIFFISGDSLKNKILLLLALGFLLIPSSYIRFEAFFFGAMIASFNDNQLQNWANNRNDFSLIAGYIILVGSQIFNINFSNWYICFLILMSLLFVNICFGKGILNSFFNIRYLRQLGNISYSFYLYHTIVIPIVFTHIIKKYLIDSVHPLITTIAAFLLTFFISGIVALLSYLIFEKPYFFYKQSRKRNSLN
nr:acyltransferase [Desulfamplus magnetovallimortis]